MADRQSDTQPLRSCRRSTLSSDVPEEEEEASIPTTAADILGRRPNGFLGLSLDDRTTLSMVYNGHLITATLETIDFLDNF